MRNFVFSLVCILSSFLPFCVWAEAEVANNTYLSVSATEHREVEEDLLIAKLRFEIESKDNKRLQDKINDAMTKALAKAKTLQEASLSTEQYFVYKDYNNTKDGESKRSVWRGSQTISITGKRADEILQLTGDLQEMGFSITSLNYVVSPEKYEEVRDSLMEIAIEKIIQKAKRVAKTIGADDIRVSAITVDADKNIAPMPQERIMTMSVMGQEYTSPIAAPGKSNIYMKVSADIMIKN